MADRLKWFLTPRARMTVGFLAAGTSTGVFLFNYLPQTYLLKNYYYDLVTMRKHGKALTVNPNLQKLFDEVTEDLGMDEIQKKHTTPFMVFGYDVWHAGTSRGRDGTLIGLPINFTYTDEKSVTQETITVNNEVLDWSQDNAKKLAEALVITKEAKKYAIAREILSTDNYTVMVQSFSSSFLVGACYGFTAHMNDSLKNFEKPRSLRIIFYGITSAFFWGIYTMQNDVWVRHIDASVDEELAKLGPEYIKGGYEFYDSLAKRNIVLRTLMGSKGENLYTAGGNKKILLRQKQLPISYRKQFFENKLKELETAKSEPKTEKIEIIPSETKTGNLQAA